MYNYAGVSQQYHGSLQRLQGVPSQQSGPHHTNQQSCVELLCSAGERTEEGAGESGEGENETTHGGLVNCTCTGRVLIIVPHFSH